MSNTINHSITTGYEAASSVTGKDARPASQPSGEETQVQTSPLTQEHDEPGRLYRTPDGDSVFISDAAIEALTRHGSTYLGDTDATTMSKDEYINHLLTYVDPEWIEESKRAALDVNWKDFSNPKLFDTKFQSNAQGAMWFENGLGMTIPLRDITPVMEPGNRANIQERETMRLASDSRKKVYADLEKAMKRAGVEIKQGQKVDFVMDETGAVRVDPKSAQDKGLAAKVQEVIDGDKALGNSFRNFLHLSAATKYSTPADMRLHVDTVLQEYTGIGYDDLEWADDGSLVPPQGMGLLEEDWSGIAQMAGHLKYLEETEGADIFKKEFSFSVTASGILDNTMSRKAGANLFMDEKMWDEKMYFLDQSSSDFVNKDGNPLLNISVESGPERVEDFWKMEALKGMIDAEGTSVYLTGDVGSSFVEDANGVREQLPYKSENYTATAKYLIEDYLIENGIDGDVRDYALKIDRKGSHDVVKLR